MNARHVIPAALAVVLMTATPIFGQYASLSLDLKITLYASDEGRKGFYSPGSPGAGDVGIVFAKGTRGDSLTEAKLGELFNLSKVRTAGEAKMDVRWPDEEIPNERIAHAFRLNGRDFLLVLVPVKVGFREKAYSFKADVYELSSEGAPEARRICGESVDLNALSFVGFFFKAKTYFLTVKLLKSGWGASIPRPPVFTNYFSDRS